MPSVDSELIETYTLMREALLEKHDRVWAEHFYKRLRKEFHIDIIPEIDLPWPFRVVHPLGTVLGRATYASHLVVYQNVGVGSNLKRERPVFNGPCVLFPGAKVLGRSVIGKNVYITANTVVNDATVPDNCIVFPRSVVIGSGTAAGSFAVTAIEQQPSWKPTKRSVVADFFPEPRRPTTESLIALGVEM